MQTAKIGKSGQLNIPKDVRERLGVKPGHHIAFFFDGEHVVLLPMTKTLKDFRGSVKVEGPQDFIAIRQQVMARKAEEWGGEGRSDE